MTTEEEMRSAEEELNRWITGQIIQQGRDQRFEETFVRHVLKYLTRESKAITRKAFREQYGEDGLTFDGLCEIYRFPIRFAFRKIPYVHKVTSWDWFNKLDKLPFFKEYREASQAFSDENFGFAFHWPHVKGNGLMVIHNHPTDPADNYTRVVRGMGKGRQLIIEQLEGLLLGLYPNGALLERVD
jgi:hypothetical protein